MKATNVLFNNAVVYMKTNFSIFILMLLFSCKASKENMASSNAEKSFPLENIKWQLVSINDKPIEKNEDFKDVFIQFDANENTMKGFAGCNSIRGSFSRTTTNITPGNIMATKMLCSMISLENEFLEFLKGPMSFKTTTDKLTLTNSTGKVAKFEALYLK